jgi:hypothetical protein
MYMFMNTSNTASDWHNLNNTVADLRAAFDAKYPSGYDFDFERPSRAHYADDEAFMLDLIAFLANALR